MLAVAAQMARQRGWPEDWLNTNATMLLPLGGPRDWQPLIEYGNVRVLIGKDFGDIDSLVGARDVGSRDVGSLEQAEPRPTSPLSSLFAASLEVVAGSRPGITTALSGDQMLPTGNGVAIWFEAVDFDDVVRLSRRIRRAVLTGQGGRWSPPRYSRGPSPQVAGPSSTAPSAPKREPCKGQSQDNSASFQRTSPPKWGQMADTRCVVPPTLHTAVGLPPS